MLRRPRRAPYPAGDGDPACRFGDLVIDPEAREAAVAGSPADLTKLEFDLLDVLSSRPRAVFTRRQLVDRV
jgi:DNA-binding response OmpR family regulator